MSHVIDAKKCKERFGTNYELELKRLEKKVKLEANLKKVKLEANLNKVELEANLKLPSGIKIKKVAKNFKEENQPMEVKTSPDISNVKFYSLEEFDNKTYVHLAGFKGVFEKLESFKSTITKKVIRESSIDFDFD